MSSAAGNGTTPEGSSEGSGFDIAEFGTGIGIGFGVMVVVVALIAGAYFAVKSYCLDKQPAEDSSGGPSDQDPLHGVNPMRANRNAGSAAAGARSGGQSNNGDVVSRRPLDTRATRGGMIKQTSARTIVARQAKLLDMEVAEEETQDELKKTNPLKSLGNVQQKSGEQSRSADSSGSTGSKFRSMKGEGSEDAAGGSSATLLVKKNRARSAGSSLGSRESAESTDQAAGGGQDDPSGDGDGDDDGTETSQQSGSAADTTENAGGGDHESADGDELGGAAASGAEAGPATATSITARYGIFRDDEGGIYFHDKETGESSYDVPEGSGIDWVKTRDEDGDEFFYNAVTGESLAEAPEGYLGLMAE